MPTKKVTVPTAGVEAIEHEDKRLNNPTADAHEFVAPEIEAPRIVRYRRDPSLDPQLVWKGKDEQDSRDLEISAPPIYIQERIEPQVLINDLVRQSQRPAAGNTDPSNLFDFLPYDDGIANEFDKVDFYNHQANWTNRMILGDSLEVMASLAEREDLRGKVQMVYIDPPYGIKFNSNWQVRADKRDVKDGKAEDASREVEQIKAFRDTWELGIHSYLSYMRDRLVASRELLTESGSVFVQIGDENVHLVRSILDEVFGSENFCSLITFATTAGAGSFAVGTNVLANVNSYLLWYAKNIDIVKYRQIYQTREVGGAGGGKYTTAELADGTRVPATGVTADLPYRLLRYDNLTSQTTRVGQTTVFPVTISGATVKPRSGGWKTNSDGMNRLLAANRVALTGTTLSYVRYFDDFPAFPLTNSWPDIGGVQSRVDPKSYVVQTSSSAIQRCLLMTTDPGDLVIDPTCGSGTTAYVAEQWGRRWITIDTSRVALALARQRLMGARYPVYLLADSVEGQRKEAELSQHRYQPIETNDDVRKGFVYERVPHITLKSIANNPDIVEGMSRAEIDAAIAKHAGHEILYDRPCVAKRTVRVAGVFTVESLSPHRALAFATELPASEQTSQQTSSATSYEDTILSNLRKAGVQNGRRAERLEFADSLEPASGHFLTAFGTRKAAEEGTPERIAIALGPEYGTVDPVFIKNAALEALRHKGIDLLLILGFAFDAQAVEAAGDLKPTSEDFASVVQERKLGKLPVLLVRMNADLAMGDELLANTGAGNLFTVFGEPDITLEPVDQDQDLLRVHINGLDVFNPTTGQIRSDTLDDIMMWSVDTDYSGEAFVVRHCYFSGKNGKPEGLDPYTKLKKALKAEVDEDVWASLYTTTSRPFPKPQSGKIAVKVINHYGDEVLKVLEV